MTYKKRTSNCTIFNCLKIALLYQKKLAWKKLAFYKIANLNYNTLQINKERETKHYLILMMLMMNKILPINICKINLEIKKIIYLKKMKTSNQSLQVKDMKLNPK